MKKILVLGAGIYQVPLIHKAKELGCYVIVCTIPGNYPGISLADEVYYEDTTDKEACLRVAKNNNISAVCTAGTDVALPSLGYIVDQLGLKGPSEKAALYSSNKLLMKEALMKDKVLTASFQKVCSISECKMAAEEIGYPVILKVVDSSGSRGIKLVREKESIEFAYNQVFQFTKKDYIIVEKFLEGEEFGAQAFIYSGKVYFTMPHSDEVYYGDTGVPIGHSVPLSEDLIPFYTDIHQESVKAIKSLGIDNAAVNIDFILMNGKTYVLEVGARCGATGLAELVSLYYGIDYYKIIIQTALGELNVAEIDNIKPKSAATALLITSDKSGKIISYNNVNDAKIYNFSMDYNIGDHVNSFKTGPDRLGQVIVYGNTVKETQSLAHEIVKRVDLQIK